MSKILCTVLSHFKAETATPPAFAALAGPKRTPFLRNTSIASNVEGILAPSPIAFTPFVTRIFADASSISF